VKFSKELYITPKVHNGNKFYKSFVNEPLLSKDVAFSGAMKLPRHRWFYYKPGFSPKLIDYFLDKYTLPVKTLVDPFCGVGTSVIASAINHGFKSHGFDISPLAIEISKAKITKPSSEKILKALKQINYSKKYKNGIDEYYLKKSFDDVTLRQLFSIKKEIENIFENDSDEERFLSLCLTSIFHEFAHAKRDGGFLRFEKKETIPNVEKRFKEVVTDFINDVVKENHSLFSTNGNQFKNIKFEIGDAREINLKANSTGIVLTSPPYLNRYDYTRIYALEMALIGLSDKDVKAIRKNTLKSHVEAKHKIFPKLQSELLDKLMGKINTSTLTNENIPEMILGYFHDIAWNISESKRILKKNGIAAFVVGNCRFSGHHVEVDSIIAEIGSNIGLNLENIFVAKARGSSVQQVHKYGEIPLRESIVVFKK
jgi:DNA modification methylase